MSFTLFVILPNEDVCSLRRLPARSSMRAVRKMLELGAGLPAHTYDLACSDGKFVADDVLLELDKNVWDGFVMRAVFRENWQILYEAVVVNDVSHVMDFCALNGLTEEDDGKVKAMSRNRGVVALFMASFLGSADLCRVLSVCVDPEGKTPFGRTPLFAAMAGDHANVMEQLLSHNAALESRDDDGISALDIAREHEAKECLRKVRNLKLFSRASSATTSMASRGSAPGSDHGGGMKKQRHVIRIPIGITTETEASFSCSNDRVPTLTSYEDGSVGSPRPQEAKISSGASKSLAAQTSSLRPSPRNLFRHSEVYTWENNLTSVSRASSAAGTHVRIPVPCNARERISSGRLSRASTRPGINWSDTMSTSSGTSRKLPIRPSLQDLSMTGPNTVLKISSSVSPPQSVSTVNKKYTSFKNDQTSAKHCARPEESEPKASSDSQHTSEAHCPAQEPPERPPSRLDDPQISTELEEEKKSVTGSICIPVPQLTLSTGVEKRAESDCDTVPRTEPQGTSHGVAGELSARDKGLRFSVTAGGNVPRSRQKQQVSWRTVKRRLRLAEDQKRTATHKAKTKLNRDKDVTRASFEQWLEKKRREKERQQGTSEEEASSDDDEEERSAENARAFNDWLKDLKERPLRGPHPFTPASLHRRKSRPLKNLIEIGHTEETVPPPDPDTYLTAYREWRCAKTSTDTTEPLTSPQHLKEAKKQMEEKRKSLLAEALTYEDWLEHSEQRHKLMQAILRADSNKLANIEQTMLQTRRAPRQIPFDQWRERVEKRETEMHHEKQHMRKQTELRHDKNGLDFTRSSAAIAHEEWLRRKNEEMQRNKNSSKEPEEGCSKNVKTDAKKEKRLMDRLGKNVGADDARENGSVVSEEERKAVWETWLEQKHQSEVAQLSRHIRKEKQLLLNLHQKKTARVTQC